MRHPYLHDPQELMPALTHDDIRRDGELLIAHFSDVHALSLGGVSPLAFLSKRLAGGLNLLLKRRHRHPVQLFEALIQDLNRVRPDHVIVTGDLTNLSLEPEFALARRTLDGLALGPGEVTVVPGNHDAYVWGAWLRHAFERAFVPYLLSDGALTPRYPLERLRGPLAVIGVSTAVPSPVPFADGRIGVRQLAAVEAALQRHAGRFRVLALHHPPVQNRHAFLRGLRDRGPLQEVLARVGAELVIHGHEHRDLWATVPGPAGPIPVVGVGSGTYNDTRRERRARYNLYRVAAGRLVAVETRSHDPASGRFTPFATRLFAPSPGAPQVVTGLPQLITTPA
jgi:3',5'-cyclic AMP phosphodiesterase CpdA